MTRTAPRKPARLRRVRSDDLGLRRALSDRLLPMLVGSMAFLAALALAGVVGASALGEHWKRGAGATLTIQVPDPAQDGRLERVLASLHDNPAVEQAQALSASEMEALLRPWLGSGSGQIALPMPAVVSARLRDPNGEAALARQLDLAAPGTLVEAHDRWIRRLAVLARSLQACAALAMAVVGLVAVAVVMVATRSGLSSRRDAIEIVHGLGATDGFIAGRFARRATRLAAGGALAGALLALPVLLGLTGLAAPFGGGAAPDSLLELAGAMPLTLWLGIPVLPPLAAAIGWITAQTTVRRWLRRLP